MWIELSLGTLIIVVSVLFHVFCLVTLAGVLRIIGTEHHERWRSTSFLLIVAVLGIVAIHTVEAWAWAAVLLRLGEFASLKEALYFSVVTSTTLGYGDLTLSDEWKLLGTFEAMGGLILFGASTAFLFQLMQRLFSDEGA